MNLSVIVVVILAMLGFAFPGQLVGAIRAENPEQSNDCKFLASVCFGAIMFCIGVLLCIT